MKNKIKVIIMGAAGRDFHNFNTYFRKNKSYDVVCFTAAQIPNIDGRKYPKELSGPLYKKGIPIYSENDLPKLIKKFNIDQVILSYSDLNNQTVMEKASLVNSSGADFVLLEPKKTMIESKKPIIAITAVRTGCGKSQTTRYIACMLRDSGKTVVVVRHPMPYGNLKKQECQRFANHDDMIKHDCTIEEREEYEPLIDNDIIVYAGVDYEKILRSAEKEADVVIWDGGNNDTPFFKPDVWFVVADPHRAGHELTYYPGNTNFRMADVIIINKEKTAENKNIQKIKNHVKLYNPKAKIVDAQSIITLESGVKNKKAIIVEDGPTLTHGEMEYGAGTIAAKKDHAKIIDPRPYVTGSIKNVYKKYSHLGKLLPAMGYGKSQMKDLQKIINKTPCDVVVSGTPIDLNLVIKVNKPIVRARYDLKVLSRPGIKKILKKYL